MEITLNGHEARVLGVLVEKAFTTPDQYPLSINAATNGSNQKSNRDPQVDFSEAEVRIALQGLRMKGLAGQTVPAGSRVEKWHHNAKETLKLEERDLAVLAELMLRGPQTAGELRGRAKRMRDIPNLEVLDQCLARLAEKGYVRTLSGGRAPKTMQTLCADLHPDGANAASTSAPVPAPAPAPAAAAAAASPEAVAPPAPGVSSSGGGATDLATRVAALEARVDELAQTIERLTAELGG
ncbi:MAG: YceH family protein [Planctomycetota bacterium]